MQILPTHRTGVSSKEARVMVVVVVLDFLVREMEGEKRGRRDLCKIVEEGLRE
jgi:hypothetical protein